MTTYNGQTLTYDAIGNPLTYRDGITFTWQNGRELATFSNDSYDIEYTYDASGLRTGKVVTNSSNATIQYTYVYENGLLQKMTRGSRTFEFSYDAYGNPVGFRLRENDTASYYYYGLNSRGDVIALYSSDGTKVATYSYDAYGELLSTSTLVPNHQIAINYNPLRYRSYVYDSDTGFYYLQSRYYDPTACRFVNADCIVSTGQGITGNNMFAYCNNNPVMSSDPTGTWALFECCPQNNCYYCQKKSNPPTQTPSLSSSINSSPIANHVVQYHQTETISNSTIINESVVSADLTASITSQEQNPALLYSYSDYGNDKNSYGVGINATDWLGGNLHVDNNINVGATVNVSPWVHINAAIGFDGIQIGLGLDIDHESYDASITIGPASIMGLLSTIFLPFAGIFSYSY